MIDIFFKSECITFDGQEVPDCWTYLLEETDEENNTTTKLIMKSEWEGYFKPPIIGTDIDGKYIFHFFGTNEQAELYKSYGCLLGKGYYEFQSLHPDIAKRCVEADYELNGEIGYSKLHEVPENATIIAIRAPSQYLGINHQFEPEQPKEKIFTTQVLEVSQMIIGLMKMAYVIKPDAIDWIKNNPNCIDYDLIAWIAAKYGEPYGGQAQAMIYVYIQGAYKKGLIQNQTFETFRDFVVSCPIEQLNEF